MSARAWFWGLGLVAPVWVAIFIIGAILWESM